jgi:hypothetical protein
MRTRCTFVALSVAVLVASPASTAERFRAIQVRTGGAPGKDMIRLSITIRDYTNDAEAKALQQADQRGGSAAVLDALRTMDHGSVTLTGGETAAIHAAHPYPTASGRRIVLVCSPAPAVTPPSGERTVRVVELRVDHEDRGDGRLIDAARVRLDDHGFLDVDGSLTTPKMLTEVKLEK